MNRREFLKGTAWMGVTAAAAGCCCDRFGAGAGGSMFGFKMKPFDRIKVGVIGLGGRGTSAVHRLMTVPGVEVTAICDKRDFRINEVLKHFDEEKAKRPHTYHGDEGWKGLVDDPEVNVVYVVTPWFLHAPMAVQSLEAGKVTFVEVPAATTVEECWQIVETSEKQRIPCMMLENCCYGEMELLGLHLAKIGKLGEIVHGEGGYIHDLRRIASEPPERDYESIWRYEANRIHKGNQYPTHGLVPVMQAMDVNRGDRFDYLVSLESNPENVSAFMKANMRGIPRSEDKIAMGDMNVTLIKTYLGRSIVVQHDVCSPRPYSRQNMLTGTKGIFWGMPFRYRDAKNEVQQALKIAWEEQNGDQGAHFFFDEAKTQKIRSEYAHPMWKQVGEIAKKVGGHGGMDFIMDLRWSYCLQNGLPLDMDVYDLAAASSLCELTEQSVRGRSRTMDVPDFTRGGWKTAAPMGIETFDMTKVNIRNAKQDKTALNV